MNKKILSGLIIILALFTGCKKDNPLMPGDDGKPVADFSYTWTGAQVPSTVTFQNSSLNAETIKWYFDNGQESSLNTPQITYLSPQKYKVKLVVSNALGTDSIVKIVPIIPIMKSVVIYLITPKDKNFHQPYYDVLQTSGQEIQSWYRSQMGNNKSFVLNPLIVDTLKGLHDSIWYPSYNGPQSGNDPRFYAFWNTFHEMEDLLGSDFDPDNYAYMVYVASPGGGAGIQGFCALGDQDLKNMIDNPGPTSNRFGGPAHELGHALGLDHPSNNDVYALMWTGYVHYPSCYLTAIDKSILNNSSFIR